MKRTILNQLLILSLLLFVSAAGCRKRPTNLTVLPGARTGLPSDDTLAQNKPTEDGSKIKPEDLLTGIKSNDPTNHQGWIENPEIYKSETVHFDYDKSLVKESERPKVVAVANGMKSNPASALRIEGHCDERGTEEYNRALGERRALALREALARLGIDPTRVDTISFGKDRPVDTGRDEAAHRKNRRGEFIQLMPPK